MLRAGLCLAGCGMRSCVQVTWIREILLWLQKRNIELVYIGGTSGGGLNGVKLAEGETFDELFLLVDVIEKIWLEIEKRGPEVIFPLSKMRFFANARRESLLDGSTLHGLVSGKLLGTPGLDVARIVSSKRPLDLFVGNMITWRQEAISNHDPRVIADPELIMRGAVGTASLFPFFPPVTIWNTPYQDGEHINLTRAIQLGCDIIFALFPYCKDKPDQIPNDFISKNFPIIPKTFIASRARTRERDRIEVEWAKSITQDVKTIENLRKRVAGALWLPWTKRRINAEFLRAPFTFQGKKLPRIVDVYIERHPDTLSVNTFGKGDLSGVMSDERKPIRKILSGL